MAKAKQQESIQGKAAIKNIVNELKSIPKATSAEEFIKE
jgi:hypothetical protein